MNQHSSTNLRSTLLHREFVTPVKAIGGEMRAQRQTLNQQKSINRDSFRIDTHFATNNSTADKLS